MRSVYAIACAAAFAFAPSPLSGCAAPAEPDDWSDGDQVELVVRVDWSGRGVPDGGWADAGPVVVEYDAGEEEGL